MENKSGITFFSFDEKTMIDLSKKHLCNKQDNKSGLPKFLDGLKGDENAVSFTIVIKGLNK